MMFGADGLRLGRIWNPVTVRILNDRTAFYMNETDRGRLFCFSNNKFNVTQAQILSCRTTCLWWCCREHTFYIER